MIQPTTFSHLTNMKIKHYGVFANQNSQLNWEDLRTDPSQLPYFIPLSKADYIERVENNFKFDKEIKFIIDFCIENGIQKIFSIGSGIAQMEYKLKKNSQLKVYVSDNNCSSQRLDEFDIFDGVFIFDASIQQIPVEDSLIFMHRVDTEFDDNQFFDIFDSFRSQNIKYVCFVPAETALIKILYAELRTLLSSLLKGKRRSFCGYSRTKSGIKLLWNKSYTIINEMTSNDKLIYFLKIK
jgi:hypothetical protein